MAIGTRSTAAILSLMVCILSVAAVHPAPQLAVSPTSLQFLPGEKKLLDSLAVRARPLNAAAYAELLRPKSVDYSENLTYIRCQNWGGGCMTYTTLHCADIINEWQAPFTPDLSWQYVLRTWDDLYSTSLRANPNAEPPTLNMIFNPGVSSEGLCRSESDYLTSVPPDHPAITAAKGARMRWDPAPSAEARAEAANYKFQISDPITPSIDTLKTLLLTYGPIWSAGPWWWNGAHAMTIIGYDDNRQEFKVLDSAGDWAHARGVFTMPYGKLTEWVSALSVVQPLPAERYQGRWAYSSRIRILGAWRGTWTVNVGVEGQVPETVYRSYGRLTDRPFCFGERLEIDVPLPAYAADFWPPSSAAKWYLQVEDNDNDDLQGTVVEWTLARRYEDPNCLSVDHWKTEQYTYSQPVIVPDATGAPAVSTPPSRNTRPPAQQSSHSGKAMLYLPESAPATRGSALASVSLRSRITLEQDPTGMETTKVALVGRLTSVGGQPIAGKSVEICQLIATPNINKPDEWRKIQTRVTDADGSFRVIVPVLAVDTVRQVLGAAYRSTGGETLCSSEPLVREGAAPLWRPAHIPIRKVIREMDGPMPPLGMPQLQRPQLQVPQLQAPVLRR